MPHNRTRLWVGLAITAVTISAVGTFYDHSSAPSAGQDERASPISAAGRVDLASDREDSSGADRVALRQPVRDYQAEVNAALARNGVDLSAPPLALDDPYDDPFDVDRLDDATTGPIDPRNVPDPSMTLASSNPVAYSTDGPVGPASPGDVNAPAIADAAPVAANPPVATNPAQGDDYGQGGTMSDSDVYRLVVNNLNDSDRDGFVRAYAAMSVEDRANLLDGFRQQIQNGP